MNGLKKAMLGAIVALRLLIGIVLIMSGWTWLDRPEPATYLLDAFNHASERGSTFAIYEVFLNGVARPNASLFAMLVGLGELFSGLSLLFGIGARVGGAVIAFQFLNYGLMGGPTGLLSHFTMILLVVLSISFQSSRRFGLDRWAHKKWPTWKLF